MLRIDPPPNCRRLGRCFAQFPLSPTAIGGELCVVLSPCAAQTPRCTRGYHRFIAYGDRGSRCGSLAPRCARGYHCFVVDKVERNEILKKKKLPFRPSFFESCHNFHQIFFEVSSKFVRVSFGFPSGFLRVSFGFPSGFLHQTFVFQIIATQRASPRELCGVLP